ncbi:MAG: response regulator [Actinobacteria bacterium]|nr:response regulator [Actinomycetota bacterium]
MADVLVIDDDENIRDIVTLRLGVSGHTVHSAGDGETGLARARELKPDLVLLDIMMPRLNGIDVCRQLRADADLAEVPIVLLTARGQEHDVDRGFEVGADDYIVKPFSLVELQSRLRRYIGRV